MSLRRLIINMEKRIYEAPEVEVIEVAVEQGFNMSVADDYQYGGTI